MLPALSRRSRLTREEPADKVRAKSEHSVEALVKATVSTKRRRDSVGDDFESGNLSKRRASGDREYRDREDRSTASLVQYREPTIEPVFSVTDYDRFSSE